MIFQFWKAVGTPQTYFFIFKNIFMSFFLSKWWGKLAGSWENKKNEKSLTPNVPSPSYGPVVQGKHFMGTFLDILRFIQDRKIWTISQKPSGVCNLCNAKMNSNAVDTSSIYRMVYITRSKNCQSRTEKNLDNLVSDHSYFETPWFCQKSVKLYPCQI